MCIYRGGWAGRLLHSHSGLHWGHSPLPSCLRNEGNKVSALLNELKIWNFLCWSHTEERTISCHCGFLILLNVQNCDTKVTSQLAFCSLTSHQCYVIWRYILECRCFTAHFGSPEQLRLASSSWKWWLHIMNGSFWTWLRQERSALPPILSSIFHIRHRQKRDICKTVDRQLKLQTRWILTLFLIHGGFFYSKNLWIHNVESMSRVGTQVGGASRRNTTAHIQRAA